jgi:hypothetical protein
VLEPITPELDALERIVVELETFHSRSSHSEVGDVVAVVEVAALLFEAG